MTKTKNIMVTTLSEFKYCIISSSVYSLVWLPLNSTTPNMNHYKYIRIFGDIELCWHKSQCVRSGLISGTVLFCMTLYCTVLYCTVLNWPLLHGGDLVSYLVLLLGEHIPWLGEGAHVPRHILQLLLQTWHSDRSITTIIYSNKG